MYKHLIDKHKTITIQTLRIPDTREGRQIHYLPFLTEQSISSLCCTIKAAGLHLHPMTGDRSMACCNSSLLNCYISSLRQCGISSLRQIHCPLNCYISSRNRSRGLLVHGPTLLRINLQIRYNQGSSPIDK